MKALWHAYILGIILLAVSTPSQTRNPSQSYDLVEAAIKTHSSFVRGDQSGPDNAVCRDIPPKYWAETIKKLNPIKVCDHRVNIVIVLKVHEQIEEGKYICLPISSYLPQNGEDGFEFTPNPQKDGAYYTGGPIFDFKRKVGS